MQETIHSILHFSRTARKHKLYDVCLTALSQLFRYTPIKPVDHFMRLREQLKCQLHSTGAELQHGYDILRRTNIEHYDDMQKAELLQMQAEFLQALGHGQEANKTYSKALMLCDTLGKGWLCWGQYCDSQFRVDERGVWATYAVNCYLQGLRHRSTRSKMLMARVLWLIAFDDAKKSLAKTLQKYGEPLPTWIWLMWIPQLLASLSQPQAAEMQHILTKLAKTHPQALFFHLRTHILENREALRRSSKANPAAQQQAAAAAAAAAQVTSPVAAAPKVEPGAAPEASPMDVDKATAKIEPATTAAPAASGAAPEAGAKPEVKQEEKPKGDAAEQVMTTMRESHKMLLSELDAFADEISSGFLLSGHHLERILELVDVLLDECFKTSPTTVDIPPTITALLEDVSRRLASEIKRCEHQKDVEVMRDCEQDLRSFVHMQSTSGGASLSLSQLTMRLVIWHQKLRDEVSSHPTSLKLELLCPRLMQIRKTHICIPLNPLEDREQPGQHMVQLDRVEADIMLVRLRRGVGSFQCRLQLRGNDGRVYPFLVEPSQSPPQRMAAERLLQLRRVLNQQLETHKDSRARHLSFNIPAIVYVTPNVRLLQDTSVESKMASLANLVQRHLETVSIDALAPQLQHRKRWATATSSQRETAAVDAFREICEQMVPATVLKNWFSEAVPCHEVLWWLRRQFCAQLALYSVLNFIMNGEDQSPENMWVSQIDGMIFQPIIRTVYNETDGIVHSNTVPWRLTRNIVQAIQPFGLEGPYISALSIVSKCLCTKSAQLQNFAPLFFRDDLAIHHMRLRRRRGGSHSGYDSNMPMPLQMLTQKVIPNANLVMNRLRTLAPQSNSAGEEKELGANSQCIRRVAHYIASAQSEQNLSHMPASWQAWF